MGSFRSGDALVTFGPDQRVLSWNAAMQELTGVSEQDAVGRPCWEVLGGVEENGAIVCQAGCADVRLAREGSPLGTRMLSIRAREGRRLVSMATIVASGFEGGCVCMHLLREEVVVEPAAQKPSVRLTPRQRQVLALLAEGTPARAAAARLGISEVTVRNHIRAILAELGCHSQLAAVAEARRRGLVG